MILAEVVEGALLPIMENLVTPETIPAIVENGFILYRILQKSLECKRNIKIVTNMLNRKKGVDKCKKV